MHGGLALARGRKNRPRFVVIAEDRVGPTPETLAKLQPDHVAAMLASGQLDEGQVDALVEIREVYGAVIGASTESRLDPNHCRSHGGISERMAWLHAHRYLPWIREQGKHATRLVIDLAWFHQAPQLKHVPIVAFALSDYRRRMLLTSMPRGR